MSVYISGMEMPTEGKWISVNIFPDGKCVVQSWYGDGKCVVQSWYGKDFICAKKLTAVPVSEHGDLIDRDKLENDIERYIGGEESRSRFHHFVQVQHALIPADKEEKGT